MMVSEGEMRAEFGMRLNATEMRPELRDRTKKELAWFAKFKPV